MITSVTAVVPAVGLGSLAVQSRHRALRLIVGLLGRRLIRFGQRIPRFRAEATVLAVSGFMAFALAGALPASGLAPLLAWLPALAVPLLVPVVLIATGQPGPNPVAVVALLGAAVPDPGALGVPPAVLAFAFMLSWGLGVGMTPMSASAITTARWAGGLTLGPSVPCGTRRLRCPRCCSRGCRLPGCTGPHRTCRCRWIHHGLTLMDDAARRWFGRGLPVCVSSVICRSVSSLD